MLALEITPQAHDDLLHLWHFIARDKPAAADQLIDSLETGWKLLQQQPHMGMAREDIGEGIRHYVTQGYVTFYEVTNHNLIILRIINGRQKISSEDLKA